MQCIKVFFLHTERLNLVVLLDRLKNTHKFPFYVLHSNSNLEINSNLVFENHAFATLE